MKIIKYDHMREAILYPYDFDIFQNPAYKEYRKNWLDYPNKRFVSNFPLNLDIHVTNCCNLRCVMCRRTLEVEKGFIKKTGFLDFKLYKKIINESAKEGCCAVHLTGNGEPLLHSQIIEMIKYARSKKILDIFMHTNATLMTEGLSKELLKAGLTRLIISMDSPVKETYEAIRKGANFEIVKNNIEALCRIKKEMGVTYPIIRIQMVEMDTNQNETAIFDELFGNMADSLGHISYINYKGLDNHNRLSKQKKYRDNFVCEQLWQRLSIECDGRVYACLVISEDFYLGSVSDKTIKEMWHSLLFGKIRQSHKLGKSSTISACKECGRQYKTLS